MIFVKNNTGAPFPFKLDGTSYIIPYDGVWYKFGDAIVKYKSQLSQYLEFKDADVVDEKDVTQKSEKQNRIIGRNQIKPAQKPAQKSAGRPVGSRNKKTYDGYRMKKRTYKSQAHKPLHGVRIKKKIRDAFGATGDTMRAYLKKLRDRIS